MSEILSLKRHLASLGSSAEKRALTNENKAPVCTNIRCGKRYWSVDIKEIPSKLSSKDIAENRIYCSDCESYDNEDEGLNFTIKSKLEEYFKVCKSHDWISISRRGTIRIWICNKCFLCCIQDGLSDLNVSIVICLIKFY